jgi:glucosamine-phosphate N-acetyltransferase
MKAKGDYYVTVIEDTRSNKIIGAATLVIERKFIHGCGIRGRLEDVVVNDTYRGKQLGKL